ncbi:MAG: EVE domain-containing protein [Xanthomonadaceae bacterium]|nr:EVE domain-containing protein [Xanthomonadaceae bacterium]
MASAEHVRLGRSEGFMQVCHGKVAPLRRIHPGDWIIYYSPSTVFRGKDRLRSFTAIGRVAEGEPYSFDMGNGFRPHRRDVIWQESREMPIAPLLTQLQFTACNRNWGYQFRFGLFEIGEKDRITIATTMETSSRIADSEMGRSFLVS